ncbi:MAG: IS1595 family transposase [Gemmatimonadota bacterium]|nr:IS1595 family transposase [Gemmatimonadota bacterium]
MQRWQCQDCTRAFSVTVGTIFHGTHIPLQQWFLVMALMVNAKKSASSYQIARDLGMRRPTVWSMMHRIRVAMAEDQEQAPLLFGIVEADEVYIGGKPRKSNRRDDNKPSKRGRGTSKAPVLGAIERGGRVVARAVANTSGTTIANFIRTTVDRAGTLLLTDEYRSYAKIGHTMNWATVNHQREYAVGLAHTNTIEGFWALVKRAWYGSHHHYRVAFMPLYIAESCYKYNHRKNTGVFNSLLATMVRA